MLFFFHSDFLNTLRKSKRVEVGMKEKQLSLNHTHIPTNLQPTYNIPTQSRKPTSLQPPSLQPTYQPTTFFGILGLVYFYQLMKIEIPALLSRAEKIKIKMKFVSTWTVKTSIHWQLRQVFQNQATNPHSLAFDAHRASVVMSNLQVPKPAKLDNQRFLTSSVMSCLA